MSRDVFAGMCSFHLQGQRISQARNQHEESGKKSNLFVEKSSLCRRQKGTTEFPW
jgi:hypothetical protein